jgi:iron complex outermembrane recepter protein
MSIFSLRAACHLRLPIIVALVLAPFNVAFAQNADTQESPPVEAAVEETLPEVEVIVETPSPVKANKKRVRKTTQQPAASAPAAQTPSASNVDEAVPAAEVAGQPTATPFRGGLKVADETFVPVTIVDSDSLLAEHGANIADSVTQKPGISSSSFTAGSSRPIVRGLDNNRVRVQENGISSQDASALSEDHAVPLDPFAAERIEVIRGPATLRYGSNAIGGVVAVENGRIPTAVPASGIAGEMKGSWRSVDQSGDGAVKVTAGGNGVVFYGDAFRRRAEDYDTPRGRQFNTFVDADGFALGTSLIGRQGFVGIAISNYQSLYGIPGEEAAEAQPRIDLEQSKVLAKGEFLPQSGGLEAIRFWFGAADYKHSELVNEGDGFEEGQRFENEQIEFRAEVEHKPIQTPFGALRGAFGTQFINRDIFGENLEGGDSLLQPAQSKSIAAYLFEELELTERLSLQAALRIEHSELDGEARDNPFALAAPVRNQQKSFTPISGSLGLKYRLPRNVVLSFNNQYVERAPAEAELFSQGVHEATETFEIGDPNLDKERAFSTEVGARLAKGPFRFDATAYFTRFDGFIFKQLTGEQCDDEIASCGPLGGGSELDQLVFSQRDARFFGVELSAQYDVAKVWNGVWGIDGQYDFVRAKLAGGENVPRIPPQRLGFGIYYRDTAWLARAGMLHAFDQNDVGAEEIATPGYTLVSAELSYTQTLEGLGPTKPELTIGMKGENLANDEVLNHTSFKRREDVLLPGASVRLFGRLKF